MLLMPERARSAFLPDPPLRAPFHPSSSSSSLTFPLSFPPAAQPPTTIPYPLTTRHLHRVASQSQRSSTQQQEPLAQNSEIVSPRSLPRISHLPWIEYTR